MRTSKKGGKKSAELKLAEEREVWPLSMLIELSQKVLNKGVIRGNEVFFSEKDRARLLSYSSKIEPILSKIKRTRRMKVKPLERVIDELREKIYHFSRKERQGS